MIASQRHLLIHIRTQPSTESTKAHRPQESMESHYQLGSFKPLIDFTTFEKRPQSSESGSGKGSSGGPMKLADRSHPPGAMSNRGVLGEDEPLANLGRSTSVSKQRSHEQKRPDTSEFKDSGLLGRNYSQRRKENGPNLPNGGLSGREDYLGDTSDGLQRKSSTRKHNSNGDVYRSGSTRNAGSGGKFLTRHTSEKKLADFRPTGYRRDGSVELDRSTSQRRKPPGPMGKPLVDLTPEYKEPPQFKNKGRGHKPDRLGAGGLIEAATTPEDPLNIPHNTIFRNHGSGPYQDGGARSHLGLVDITPHHKEPL